MSDREHLLSELDSLENRQHSLHIERAALELEEQLLLQRKVVINQALGELSMPVIFGYGSEGEYL